MDIETQITTTKELCVAIIARATTDYANALVNDNEKTIKECERFFTSKWFDTISPLNIDGGEIMNRLKSGAQKFKRKANETIDRGFFSKKHDPQYRAFECPFCGGNVYSVIQTVHTRNGEKYNVNPIKCDSCELKMTHYLPQNDGKDKN